MNAHHLETTVEKDGMLVLEGLPFQAGDSVEVIIITRSAKSTSENHYPLRGTPVTYEAPTEPVALEDWEALT
ncbi:MAG: hypothetical protein HY231_07620 [Acidobacteria bacterium]|nr:hypothetical protein [Acidobacteriota bacterium]